MENTDFEKIINHIPGGLMLLDDTMSIIMCNDECLHITGTTRADLLGRDVNVLDIYHKSGEDTRLDIHECLSGNINLRKNFYIKDHTGVMRLIFFQATELKDSPGLYALISIIDLTNVSECEKIFSDRDTSGGNSFKGMIGKDKKMKEIFKMIRLAAESNSTVLITGESGTGKELVARSIHDLSARRDKPFIAVNCSALSESLLESELFGHVKGAFTGAYTDKTGKFEAANGGTIFLDEIGDISPLIQLKLLRVLQEKTITRVGGNQEKKVDMRIITATNKDLRKLIHKGEFRDDLFYRLKVFPIHTVPLRNRKNDIPLLSGYFIDRFNRETGKNIQGLTMNALRLMMDYCWPGNVRELENCIEHAFVICSADHIDIFDLPQELRIVALKDGLCGDVTDNDLHDEEEYITKDTRDMIKKTSRTPITKEDLISLLESNNWNKAETARQLGISRVALWKKIKKFNIDQ